MRRFSTAVVVVSSLLAASLSACGGSGGGGGFGQSGGTGAPTLTGITPNPVQGCDPVPFTLTGTNFSQASGSTATVTFRAVAPAGIQPFGGGTTDHASVTASITSDTTITGLTPPILICGIPSITVEIDVLLESGASATSTGVFTLVFNAPAIANISPNPIPAALPTPFTITGTGFGPVGGPVSVRFTGDNGALLWQDGTHNYTDVVGIVQNATTITGITPIATVCDIAQIGASIQLFFPDGCCTLPTVAGFVQFIAPTVTSLSLNPVPAAIQQAGWQITGTNFGPAGTTATVRFQADPAAGFPGGFPLFSDGTKPAIDIPAIVGGAGPVQTLTLTTPLAAVCGVASRGAGLRIISPFGSSCVQTATGFVSFNGPTITGVQAPIPGAIATALTITGTNFGPANSSTFVRFLSTGGASIFEDGTTAAVDVPAVVGATPNTVLVTTPLVTACTSAVTATVRVFAPEGDACVDSAAAYLTFSAPAITSIAPAASNAYPAAPNTTFTITSATPTYGPVGSPVEVRFASTNALNIFNNGARSEATILGTVASSTTITGALPTASLCGIASETVDVRISLQNGSCQVAPALLTYNAPTITQLNGAAPPAVVPSSNPVAITIGGSGFAPLNGTVNVTFVSDPAGPPLFGDGTQRVSPPQPGLVNGLGTLITVVPPHATVSPGAASRSAGLVVTLPNGACVATATTAITYTAPALTTFNPTGGTLFSAFQTGFTISGSNFGPTGSEASVRFTAGSGTPFGNGTQSSFEVPATVTNSTTITGTAAPLAALCGSPAVLTLAGTVRVIFQDGSQSSNTAAITYQAPVISTVTAVGFGPTPVAFTITGTGFAPTGTFAQVTFTSTQAIFAGGTQTETTVTGIVSAANTITGTTPVTTICGIAPPAVDVRASFYGGSCTTSVGALTPSIPTITGALSPSTVPATIQTLVTINGTGFGPAGSLAQVTLSIPGSPPASTPFGNGSLSEITVTGTVGAGGTSMTFFSPLAATCTANVVADVRVKLANGSCSATSAGALTFQAPTLTATNLVGSQFTLTNGNPTPYNLSGSNFAPNGGQVTIRYTTTNGSPVFDNGTSTQIDVAGSITNSTTISTTLPLARVCVNTSATVRIYFACGACAESVGLVSWVAPTGLALSTTSGSAFNPTATNVTGSNFPPAGTPVVLHWSAATPIFAGGTSASFDQSTSVTVGGAAGSITSVVPPIATACVNTVATLNVEFGNPSATGCVLTAGTYTYNAPTATLIAPASVDAVAPASTTITTANMPPNATLTIRYLATTGTPYEGGTSGGAETVGVVNPTGTAIAVTSTPGMTLCGDNATGTATLQVLIANNCAVTVVPAFTYTGPVLTQVNGAAPPAQVSALTGAGTTMTVTGTNFGGLPVGSVVTARLTSATVMFAEGTETTADIAGTVNAANSVQFLLPAATLCGVASANADVRVFLLDGSCDILANAITFNAPQISAAPAGFTPQNLPYAGAPFTITGPGGNSAFGPTGATVNVRFSVAAGTPFQGGTASFAIVSGLVVNATTVTGVAPAVIATADTVPTVTARVEFEDGSCTNGVTTSYLRPSNRVAVAGGGNVYLLDQTTPTLLSTIAVAGANSTAFSPNLGYVFVTTGATGTVRVIDLDAGTTAGTGTPTLLVTPSISIPGNLQGIAVDTKNSRAWVVNNTGAGNTTTVAVIDLATRTVVRTFGAGMPAATVPTGRIYWDPANDRMLLPGIDPGSGAADQLTLFDATLGGLIGTPISIPAGPSAIVNTTAANTLDWTGGLAVDPVAGLLFLSYDDVNNNDTDAIEARSLSDPSVTTGVLPFLVGNPNPTAAMAASPNTGRFFVYMAGPGNVQSFTNTATPAAVGAALATTNPPTDIPVGATTSHGFLIEPAGNVTQMFDVSTNLNVGAAAATAGGTFGAATSP